MSAIYAVQVATSRYAPEGSEAICLYDFNGAEGMTFAQLMIAVSIRRAAVIEEACVNYMNKLNQSADEIKELSDFGLRLLSDAYKRQSDWLAFKASLKKSPWARTEIRDGKEILFYCGIDISAWADDVGTYPNRVAVFDTVRNRLEQCNAESETMQIELQANVGRRDQLYSTASVTTLHYGQSGQAIADGLSLNR